MLGWVAFLEGSLPEAEAALTESLPRWQAEGHQRWQGVIMARLAAVALVQGRWRQCVRGAQLRGGGAVSEQKPDSLSQRGVSDGHRGVPGEMGLMARLMGRESDRDRWEAEALALREAIGVPAPPVWCAWHDRLLRRHA